jgi:hypothetical protein
MSDRFIRVYDKAGERFFWASFIDFEVREADTLKACQELKQLLLEGKPFSKEQWDTFGARLFPAPREPFVLIVERPQRLFPGVPRNAVSAAYLASRYGTDAVNEMIQKGMLDVIPDYNACIPNIPVRYTDEEIPFP